MPSFIEITPPSADISRHAKQVLTDNCRTSERTTRKHGAFRLCVASEHRRHTVEMYASAVTASTLCTPVTLTFDP